jgi:hypothetical protein
MNNNIHSNNELSARQKMVLAIYCLVAIIIVIVSASGIITNKHNNTIIFFFGILWPLLLLAAFLQDLRNNRYFFIWLIISIIQFTITLFTFNNPAYLISPSQETQSLSIPADFYLITSTESLKSLLLFLLSYQMLRYIYRHFRGSELTNVYALSSWYNERDERKITTLDVLMNLSLYLIIVIGNFVPMGLFI